MDIITILVFSCLASAIITYGLGISVYTKNPKSPVNRLFLAAMLTASFWAAGEFLIWQSTGPDEIRFWLKASSLWPLVLVLTLHFVLAFTRHPLSERRNLKYLIVFLYIPAVLISLLEIFTELVFTVTYLPGRGYIYIPAVGSPVYYAQAVMFFCLSVFFLYICISSWKNEEKKREREQILLVMLGVIPIMFSGIISVHILPYWGIHIPNLVFLGFVWFSLLITSAIIWRGLFMLSITSAVTDIIQTMPDSLILADENGRIQVSNRSATVLFREISPDIKNQVIGTLLPRQSGEAIQNAIRDRSTFTDMEVVLDTRDYRVVSIAGSPVIDPDGNPGGIVLIIRDITGRKATERALRLVNEKLSLLSQLTRHDINNQILALNGYLQLAKEKADSPGQERYIAASMRVAGKIESHLRFSRQYEEIGKHDPAWQPARDLIEQAISDLAHDGVDIHVNVPVVELYSDPLTEKVFYNLLENALRHGGDHLTTIRISAAAADGDLVIIFEDNGAGVAADEKEQIFARFYGKNTGLGLTFSRDILSVTDIRITETGVPGTGARFEIRVPPQSWRYAG